jgi:2-amino-4-hydroxy-6-hydroxymethyldihydropteridine diphosphokinase
MARAYLSLGSNVEPRRHLRAALAALRERFGPLVVSPAYRSRAVGFDGPDFINLAVALDSDLPPAGLDAWLHGLEDRLGRRREGPRYADRTLDVDLLAWVGDDGRIQMAPRPELAHAFVLRPLAEIAPQLRLPDDDRSLAERWAAFAQAREPLTPVSLDDDADDALTR